MSDLKRWKPTVIIDPLLTDDCSEQVKLAVAAERKAIAVELRANVIIVGDDKRFNTFLAKLEKENE